MAESPRTKITGLDLGNIPFRSTSDAGTASDAHAELDLALNPQTPTTNFDVLHSQTEQPEPEAPSGVHDLAEVIKKRPTDIDLTPSRLILPGDNPTPNPSATIEIATAYTPREEKFNVPTGLEGYVNGLIESGNKRLRLFKFDIEELKSKREIREKIDKYKLSGQLTEDQEKTMLGFLGDAEQETVASGDKKELNKTDVETTISDLRAQIKEAEESKDEPRILELEKALREREQDLNSINTLSVEKDELDLARRRKETLEKSIPDLKLQIEQAESDRDEARVLELEASLHATEQDLLSTKKAIKEGQKKNSDNIRRKELDREIKEQTEKVKMVENSDAKAYKEELTKLRSLEKEKKSLDKEKKVVSARVGVPSTDSGEVVDATPALDTPRVGVPAPETTPVEAGAPPVPPPVTWVPWDSVPPIPTPDSVPTVKTPEQINNELESARSEYAAKLIEWKNKNREKKKWFTKIVNDLGAERNLPESAKSPELLEAERVYIQAKKQKNQNLFGQDQDLSPDIANPSHTVKFNHALLEQAEKEYYALQEKIMESAPPLEKGSVAKALTKWSSLPQPARIALSATLMTGAGMLFGTVALSSAAATVAYRGVRSAFGAAIGQVTGGIAEDIYSRKTERRHQKAGEAYGREINQDNFEAKEKELMRFYEKEQNQEKRNRLKKAAVMVAAGAGANALFSEAVSPLLHTQSGADLTDKKGGGSHPVEGSRGRGPLGSGRSNVLEQEGKTGGSPVANPESVKVGGTNMDAVQKPTSGGSIPEAPGKSGGVGAATEMASTAKTEIVSGSRVELSSNGFLQDIHNIKAKILAEHHGNMDEIPEKIKTNIFNKSSVDIAKQYGLYDPEKGLSGMGHAGEHLSVDSEGHLVYEHGGKVDTLFDTKAGHVKTFTDVGGKMFHPDLKTHALGSEVSPDSSLPNPDLLQSTSSVGSLPSNFGTPVELTPLSSLHHIPVGTEGDFVEVVSGAKGNVVVYGFPNSTVPVEIGHEYAFGKGKILALDDKFQDGRDFGYVRNAFNEAFNKMPTDQLGADIHPVDFEGGQIHVVSGVPGGDGNAVHVLLNGKEIARGVADSKTLYGGKIDLLDTPGIKSGFWHADTVYERAFKVAKKFIRTLPPHTLATK